MGQQILAAGLQSTATRSTSRSCTPPPLPQNSQALSPLLLVLAPSPQRCLLPLGLRSCLLLDPIRNMFFEVEVTTCYLCAHLLLCSSSCLLFWREEKEGQRRIFLFAFLLWTFALLICFALLRFLSCLVH